MAAEIWHHQVPPVLLGIYIYDIICIYIYIFIYIYFYQDLPRGYVLEPLLSVL